MSNPNQSKKEHFSLKKAENLINEIIKNQTKHNDNFIHDFKILFLARDEMVERLKKLEEKPSWYFPSEYFPSEKPSPQVGEIWKTDTGDYVLLKEFIEESCYPCFRVYELSYKIRFIKKDEIQASYETIGVHRLKEKVC